MSNADKPDKLSNQESPHNARQILDELDELMDRMMALPVQDGRDSPADAALPNSAESVSAAAVIEPAPVSETAKEEPEPIPAKEHDNAKNASLRSYTIPDDKLQTRVEPPSYKTDLPTPVEKTADPWSEILPPISPIPKYEPPKRTDDPIPAVGWHPLLRFNEIFDLSTRWMGPIGIWLRGKWGRALLGICGLAMLAIAVLWGFYVFSL